MPLYRTRSQTTFLFRLSLARYSVDRMTTLPFAKLQPFVKRRFLPAELELGDWETIEPWFDRLAAQASACETATQLEDWLLDWSELKAAAQEETARRYIAMTCDTEDKTAENAHLEWVKLVLPHLKTRSFEMAQLFIAHPARPALPADRYLILNRLLETEVRLFREENLTLETADMEIRQRYQKRCGAQSASFRGGEMTMSQLVGLLKDPDRGLREEAWTAQARRRLEDTMACDADFDELVRLRTLIATQAGYARISPSCQWAFLVQRRGFRSHQVVVVTSLLDRRQFPDRAIAELYAWRWQVELRFRQIKTNLSLDVLRGLFPQIIERELWMHAIAYNIVRALLLEAAITHDVPVERLSFKGAVDAIFAWTDLALRPRARQRRARRELLARLAGDPVPIRPNRSEPRVRKRRPKNYHLTRPRSQMTVSASRNLK